MMRSDSRPARTGRPALVTWLVRVNGELGAWVAATSWWRLIVLFLVILLAANLIGDLLELKHGRTRVVADGRSVQVGPEGIRITRRRQSDGESVQVGPEGIRIIRRKQPDGDEPAGPASNEARSTSPGSPAVPAPPGMHTPRITIDAVEDEELQSDARIVSERVFTFRGFLGDLGAALIIVLFAYLAATKIVVRKVAQADAKVRTAEDAAGREAMERQLAQAKLQVLQAQVEPHFLFNTLAAVDYLIETDPVRASQMQKALITYLRGALPQMRQESSTLGREMRLIRSYLELIKMRIEDRLEVRYEVPQGLESAEFPPMMLQSVVENAIKHGIEPKPEGGQVTVSARVQNGQLWVEVKDTGVGIVDMNKLEAATSGTGLGLQNIRERLAMLYPAKGRLTLMSDDAAGTTVRIAVPYKVVEQPLEPGEGDEQGEEHRSA